MRCPIPFKARLFHFPAYFRNLNYRFDAEVLSAPFCCSHQTLVRSEICFRTMPFQHGILYFPTYFHILNWKFDAVSDFRRLSGLFANFRIQQRHFRAISFKTCLFHPILYLLRLKRRTSYAVFLEKRILDLLPDIGVLQGTVDAVFLKKNSLEFFMKFSRMKPAPASMPGLVRGLYFLLYSRIKLRASDAAMDFSVFGSVCICVEIHMYGFSAVRVRAYRHTVESVHDMKNPRPERIESVVLKKLRLQLKPCP